MPELKAKDSLEKVRLFQRTLYQAAKRNPKRRFHALYDKICRFDVLERAWKEVRRNGGSEGVDGQTLDWIEKECGVERFLGKLSKELRQGNYRALPVRRVEIPKARGGTRPLGIPTIRDRVVQAACRIVIEPIFEADFLENSYGFRPKRSAHQAHQEIKRLIFRGGHWVVDGDIENYFGSIEHWKLMKLLKLRISDHRVLKLIRSWLKVGVMKEGKLKMQEAGTPQGGVISPLLSNIYLHFLDQQWQKNYAHLGKLIRFADDFVILCRRQKAAQLSLEIIQSLLKRLSLKLHPEKTRLVGLYGGKEGFDFLGFHFRKLPSRSSPKKRLYCYSWPSNTAMKRVRQKVKANTGYGKRLQLSIQEVVEALNPILRGWVNYFRIGNSGQRFTKLDRYVFHRMALFRKKKYRLKGHAWPFDDYRRQGIFTAQGKISYALGREVVGKPYDRKGHVRFDEGALETESRLN